MTYPAALSRAAGIFLGAGWQRYHSADAPESVESIQSSYMAQVQRRRLYGGLTLLIFVVLMVSGFNIADDRNAGGFWEGLHQIGDYPADVLSEAWEKRADLPGLIVKYFPGSCGNHQYRRCLDAYRCLRRSFSFACSGHVVLPNGRA
jgi:hypothetical protein